MEELFLQEIERPVIGVAEPLGGFDDLVEHRLQPSRTGDGAQDATDRALLLAEILELAGGVMVVAGRAGHGAQLRSPPRDSLRRASGLLSIAPAAAYRLACQLGAWFA